MRDEIDAARTSARPETGHPAEAACEVPRTWADVEAMAAPPTGHPADADAAYKSKLRERLRRTSPHLNPGRFGNLGNLEPGPHPGEATRRFQSFLEAGDYYQDARRAVHDLTFMCHGASYMAGWWGDVQTGDLDVEDHHVPVKLCLIHSEISEAMEGHRKSLMDDKLPHRPMIEVELADAMIRILDLAGALRLDLGGALVEKMRFNAQRADHKPENRAKENGKGY